MAEGLPPSPLLIEGMRLHQAGRLAEALERYERVAGNEPGNFAAFHLSGVLRAQQRNYEDARRRLEIALQIGPRSAVAQGDLGRVLRAERRYGEAVESFKRALQMMPERKETYVDLGATLTLAGRLQEAIDCYRESLRRWPDLPAAHNAIGKLSKALGKHNEAIAAFASALRLAPDNVEAHFQMGITFAGLGQYDAAIACYGRVVRLSPRFAQAYAYLGGVLIDVGRCDEAISACRAAVVINPDLAPAHNNMGIGFAKLGKRREAIECYRRALEISPGWAAVHKNLGNTLMELKRFDEAIACFGRVLSLKPGDGYALTMRTHLEMHICDWSSFDKTDRDLVEAVREGVASIYPFPVLYTSSTPADQLRAARMYIDEKRDLSLPAIWRGERYRHEKIRIGYVSADFHEHATAYLMAELFESHDRERFELFAFSIGPNQQSPMRARLTAAFDHFIDVRLHSDRDAWRAIARNQIDIAVDLKGFTRDSRIAILAARPAPIQVNYLGYPGTMGADFIDYIIADRWTIPVCEASLYAEKVVHLPDCYQVNDRKRMIAERTPTRAECGLPERGFVFCCFNNSLKITPRFFDIWMRLLNAAPGSVLWLMGSNPWAEANIRKEAEARGVPAARLVFAPHVAPSEHLARYRVADLFLDTLPYNAHTTTSDALWAGLPVLTCEGTTFAGRVAGSLLRAIGMPELIARDLSEYEALALRLVTDPARLSGIRAKLARNRLTTPLFDTDRFRRHIEAAYLEMWRTWQQGEASRSFAVNTDPAATISRLEE
ncbi:MAG TPA: tetratricopeptide repeat protein [Alphaproteobacteria bacterium]|nr:tetratricopeptide repeat protein [Alphaproteobacteria bacterium]